MALSTNVATTSAPTHYDTERKTDVWLPSNECIKPKRRSIMATAFVRLYFSVPYFSGLGKIGPNIGQIARSQDCGA
jgi:hypothetical protein